jgi:hypothetical protein
VAWNRRSYAKFHKVENGHAVARPKHRRNKADFNPEADWIVVEDQHQPLVPKERWERAQLEMRVRGGTVTGEQLRAARRNSPYVLSGLIRCKRCGANLQGYKTRKGRRKPGRKQVVSLYYCCGAYVRQGNAVCERALISKHELEEVVLDLASEHLTGFVETGGAALLATMVQEHASVSTSQEAALAAKVAADKAKLDELVECLTPALAPALEPKIVKLREAITLNEARLRDIDRMRVTQDEAKAWVDELVRNAAALGDLLRSGTVAERKAILRGLAQEIVVDAKNGVGEVAFYAIPKASSIGPSANAKRTLTYDASSHEAIAGGRLCAEERTEEPGIWRRGFALGRTRRAA